MHAYTNYTLLTAVLASRAVTVVLHALCLTTFLTPAQMALHDKATLEIKPFLRELLPVRVHVVVGCCAVVVGCCAITVSASMCFAQWPWTLSVCCSLFLLWLSLCSLPSTKISWKRGDKTPKTMNVSLNKPVCENRSSSCAAFSICVSF